MHYQNQANAGYSQGLGGAQNAAVAPRTISSASSRLDAANERLEKARDHLTAIADQLGSLRAVSSAEIKGVESPPTCGAVARLNESADYSHRLVGDIEGLLSSISNALG